LIDEVLQIGTTHSRAAASDNTGVHIDVELNLGHVVLQNLDATTHIRQADND
jgi:hypothetical protein